MKTKYSNIEFYNFDEKVMFVKDGDHAEFTEDNKELVTFLIKSIQAPYAQAYERLLERTKKLQHQPNYRNYRMALLFCKCNFGNADTLERDVDRNGVFRFERVQCPLRGICSDEGIICQPTLVSKVSPAELRVLRLLKDGRCRSQIAHELQLSEMTVRNHIQSMYAKLNLRSESQLVKWALTHQCD